MTLSYPCQPNDRQRREALRGMVDFLIDTQILTIASDPRVMFAAGALFLISLFMRWRFLALSLFGVAALVAVARYSRLRRGGASRGMAGSPKPTASRGTAAAGSRGSTGSSARTA